MNVDNLHRFYGTELDIELSLKLNISKSTVSKWRSFGIPSQGIEDMIPLDWNKKVTVERYE